MRVEVIVVNGREIECYVIEYKGIKEYYDRKTNRLVKIESVEGGSDAEL
jgi:hypothetical protein